MLSKLLISHQRVLQKRKFFYIEPIKIRRVEFSRSIIGFHFNNKTRGLVQLQHYCVPVALGRMDSINAKITFRTMVAKLGMILY